MTAPTMPIFLKCVAASSRKYVSDGRPINLNSFARLRSPWVQAMPRRQANPTRRLVVRQSNRVTSDRYSIKFDARNVLNQRPFLGEEWKTSARAECFSVGPQPDMGRGEIRSAAGLLTHCDVV